MIWATVSSQSCFCWLFRASPSLAARNIINLISVLTIWWCPCVESSLVLLERGCLLWLVRSLGKTLLAFALLHSVFQSQICLLLQVFHDFLLLHFKIQKAIKQKPYFCIEHSPTHQQKNRLKICWAWPCPSEQDSVSPTVSLSHQEASISLLSLFIEGQT